MVGIDPDGADLRRGGRFARLEFGAPIADRRQAREELVRLAREKA
jgi:putative heme iron utilization protein